MAGGDCEQLRCARRGRGDERPEMRIERGDLLVKIADTSGERPQRNLGRLQRLVQAVRVGAQTGAEARLAAAGLALAQWLAELVRRGHDQLGELVERRATGLDRALARDTQL